MPVVELQRERWRVCACRLLECKAGKCQWCSWNCPEWKSWAFNREIMQTHWVPLVLVTAESWGHGHMSPQAAAAPLCSLPQPVGEDTGAQLSASAISWCPRGVSAGPSWSSSTLLPVWQCPALGFPSFQLFWDWGGRAQLAGGWPVLCAREGVGKQLLTLKSSFCFWNESAFFQPFCLSSPLMAGVSQITGLSLIVEEPQTGSATAFTLLYVSNTWKCRDGVYQKSSK